MISLTLLSGTELSVPIVVPYNVFSLKLDIQQLFPEYKANHMRFIHPIYTLEDDTYIVSTDPLHLFYDDHYHLPPRKEVWKIIQEEYPYVPDRIYQRQSSYHSLSFIGKLGLVQGETYEFTIQSHTTPYYGVDVEEEIAELPFPHGKIENSCRDIIITDFNDQIHIKGKVVRINFIAKQLLDPKIIYMPQLVLENYKVYINDVLLPSHENSTYLVFHLGLLTSR